MRTSDWVRRVPDLADLGSVVERLSTGGHFQSTCYESRPVLLAAAWVKQPRKVLVVTANYERALQWQAKLILCGVPLESIKQLPSGTSALFEDATPEHIALSDRLGALKALAQDKPVIVVAAPQAALERTLPKDVLLESQIDLKIGIEIEPSKLLRQLVNLGYEPQEPVRLPGQFSHRGGIIDIFPTGRDTPVRIELFGDQVESLRAFDPNTQRSIRPIDRLSLVPSRETIYTAGAEVFRDLIVDSLEREAAGLPPELAEKLNELVRGDAEAIGSRTYFDRLDLYRPILHPDSGCALDLLAEDDLLVLDEPLELEAIALRAEDELGLALESRVSRGELLKTTTSDFLWPVEHLATHQNRAVLTSMNSLPDWLDVPEPFELSAISLEPYRGRSEALTVTLKTYLNDGFRLVFTTDQPTRAKSVLSQVEVYAEDVPTSDSSPTLYTGNLGGGFVLPQMRLAVITDAELFGVARLKLPQKRFMEGAPVATVLDLKPGDYVVHIHFGIGVFRGLVKKEIDGVSKEFLFVEYQAPDKLFVPADQLDRIQKYLNPGDEHPKLNRLTGTEWQKTLGKAKEEAKAFARDLVKLYAKRKDVQRRPYGPDTPFQNEMETTFPWVETPSQLDAIRDVKVDMIQDFPMDRLVCGDVGFGKTEVAIRAAFKAVQAGRQVAVLCPTTILSEQHFRNFEERLGPFGTKLALINRFTHSSDKAKTVTKLKSGEVEIVVGTHSLLGVGIKFKDLGLVIIDEEQRFGVKQKEMLKELRTEVDVLTLSATPIPRTLSMALMDIRQMSLINDPPPGRLPIRTFVRPYSGDVVREAILREVSRGGQVFYVYNRVESILHVEQKLKTLVPTAKIGVAHGQMHEKELEPVMVAFIKGELDILLSTTIIESGIDIPNANTLIVEGADRLGLAQLYQLRGRVGRSDRQAYAYLLYSSSQFIDKFMSSAMLPVPDGRTKKRKPTMSEGAMQRLQALQEFSSLGSGYSLAFRDLQIRGAGELLGKKQHGAMVTVGYELYTQLINEAVAQLKMMVDDDSLPFSDVKDPLENLTPLPQFEVPVPALLPETYIKDQAQRLYYYQRMMSSRTETSLAEVQTDVEDRYGHPVQEVVNAFAIMGLRMRARDLGIEKLDAAGGRISIAFKDRASISPRAFSILGKKDKAIYLTRESLIAPFTGNPLIAIERILMLFAESLDQVQAERAQLMA